MRSEHRLHPLSIVFNLGSQLRAFVIPALLFIFGAASVGFGWERWLLWLLIPYTVLAIVRYVTLRYRYDEAELVIRSGLLFRNERHIPYARIQNIDAVQNVLHRMFGVVTVRLQTAGGSEPEATMSVLPIGDLALMRERVFAGRAAQPLVAREGDAAPAARERPEVLLRLSPRELLLCGLIDNRGLVVVAAAFGLVWEVGFLDDMTERMLGDEEWGRGVWRSIARAVFAEGAFPVRRFLVMLAAFAGFLILVRLLSAVWALIRLHGFTLTRSGDDLQATYGLLTHVAATVPLRRVQSITIREGPLHRWAKRVSVRAVTAGGTGEGASEVQRESLAPVLARSRLREFLRHVAPDLDLAAVAWRGPDSRAFRREVKGWLAVMGLVSVVPVAVLGWWGLPVFAALEAWAWYAARRHTERLQWGMTDAAVLFRKGWLWRYVTITPLAKIQAVTRYESPFDRRAHMERIVVDAAGAGDDYRVDIPYLPRDMAHDIAAKLAAAAARTEFKW